MTGQITFRAIVNDKDNWQRYQVAYAGQVTAHQIAEVEKMLRCGDPTYGYATYMCGNCGETKRVAFSCKSRVCSRCGKVHADEWSQQVVGRMFNVTHRHITLTVAEALWGILERHPEWRKVLFAAANVTLRKAVRHVPGMVMVMHPYGKDLKVNYHLHVLITEGGLDEKGRWQAQSFISYKLLRKVWQYEVLTGIRQKMREEKESENIIDKLFRKYRKGFYVHAEPRVKHGEGISRYIGRYIRHPAIADTRIIGYDGEEVTFYYKERREAGKKLRQIVKMPVLAFIHGVVRHIPPKQFKLVRYYGLYAPRTANKVAETLLRIGRMMGRKVKRLNWRGRMKKQFGKDPLQCQRCGVGEMELFSLTLPWRGKMVTIGGWEWLMAAIMPSRPPPLGAELAIGEGIQLELDFTMPGRWVQLSLI